MDEPEPAKFSEQAFQDIARYQEHLFRLMIHNDDRALRVLSLYIATIGLIITAGFGLYQAKSLGAYPIIFLAGVTLSLAVGCVFAYWAAWSADIYLPGRKPDFWRWANEISNPDETIRAYLEQAQEIIIHNEEITNRAATRLGRSYQCGVIAPLIGLGAALFAWAARTFIS
jgi:hypothetical protein